jgi:hypothetical protein
VVRIVVGCQVGAASYTASRGQLTGRAGARGQSSDMNIERRRTMSSTDCLPRPAVESSKAADVLICVIGTGDVMSRCEASLDVLQDQEISLINWRLDDDFGEPPPAADWADGLIVLNSDVWAAPTGCARLQALLKMAWRCGRTIALCGDAVNSLSALGFATDVPAEAEGLFLCPDGPCRETLTEFLDAVHEQPHRRR